MNLISLQIEGKSSYTLHSRTQHMKILIGVVWDKGSSKCKMY